MQRRSPHSKKGWEGPAQRLISAFGLEELQVGQGRPLEARRPLASAAPGSAMRLGRNRWRLSRRSRGHRGFFMRGRRRSSAPECAAGLTTFNGDLTYVSRRKRRYAARGQGSAGGRLFADEDGLRRLALPPISNASGSIAPAPARRVRGLQFAQINFRDGAQRVRRRARLQRLRQGLQPSSATASRQRWALPRRSAGLRYRTLGLPSA